MAAMPSSFGCGSSGSSRIRDQEVTTEVLVESPQTLSSNDDYYDYDLNDYDSSRYVKPHLRGDTTYPTIRDVSKLDLNIYLKAPFLSVLLLVTYARPHR